MTALGRFGNDLEKQTGNAPGRSFAEYFAEFTLNHQSADPQICSQNGTNAQGGKANANADADADADIVADADADADADAEGCC